MVNCTVLILILLLHGENIILTPYLSIRIHLDRPIRLDVLRGKIKNRDINRAEGTALDLLIGAE